MLRWQLFTLIQFNSIQFNSTRLNIIQNDSIPFTLIRFNVIRFNSLQYEGSRAVTVRYYLIHPIYPIHILNYTISHQRRELCCQTASLPPFRQFSPPFPSISPIFTLYVLIVQLNSNQFNLILFYSILLG